jgi:hypothetical protein
VSDQPPDPNAPGWGTPQPGPWGQPPGPPPGSGYGAPPGYGGPPGYGAPPGYGYGYGAPQTDGKAIGALVLAILAWVVCPVIPAIVALILAGQSSRDIAQSGGRLGGAGFNTAAKVISWINIGITVLVVIIFIAAAASTSNNEYLGCVRVTVSRASAPC